MYLKVVYAPPPAKSMTMLWPSVCQQPARIGFLFSKSYGQHGSVSLWREVSEVGRTCPSGLQAIP
jgi:hypothetical protein